MAAIKKKKKWYDSWWGALWALAVIDGSPGRSVRAFMEVDEALRDLDVEGESAVQLMNFRTPILILKPIPARPLLQPTVKPDGSALIKRINNFFK